MESRGTALVDLDWQEGARHIDECTYLFVESIREPEDLTLELTIKEAKAQPQTVVPGGSGATDPLLVDCLPIETDRTFRLTFDRNHMVSYAVLNESYGKYPVPPENFTGKLFRVFSSSHLRDFTVRTTYAEDILGAVQHYQIVCLNHVVDVICTQPPMIAVSQALDKGLSREGQ